jgi:rhodanese-related sulfurtransferase
MLKKMYIFGLTALLVCGLALSSLAQADKPAAPATEKQPAAAATPATAPEKTPAELPKRKQTTLGLYVTAKEAYEMYQKDPDKIKVLDCRTPQEYAFIGHAPMAVNIPSKFMTYKWDAKKKMYVMEDNPNFVKQVKKVFKPTDIILDMCRSGDRSGVSVNKLAQAGFKHVYSVTDGFEGDMIKDPKDPNNGRRLKNGWKNAGLPWTYDLDPNLMYLPGGKPQAK